MANENGDDECSEELDDLPLRCGVSARLEKDFVAAFRGKLAIVRFLHEVCKVNLLPHLDKIAFKAAHNGANAMETIPYLHETLGFNLSSPGTGNAACLAYLRDCGVGMRTQEDEALVTAARYSSGFPALKWLHKEVCAGLWAQNGAPLLIAKRGGHSRGSEPEM
ncbi:hypothetical protein HDU88_006360 [Geranomyces variabilis]|nr:hypothetical protein HDU88_006360 [Geranomyces variabilis]